MTFFLISFGCDDLRIRIVIKEFWSSVSASFRSFSSCRLYREGGGLVLEVAEVSSLSGFTFQEWAIRLPVRLHGWGFRSLASTSGPAYIGMLETAVPFMAGQGNICPQLSEVFGGVECWGPEAVEDDRWRKVLDSGCREGRELKRVWIKINVQAQGAAHWVQEEVPQVLATPLRGLGEGSVTGATRGNIMAAQEELQAKVPSKRPL